MLLKRTVTRKRLDANQRNASHSTVNREREQLEQELEGAKNNKTLSREAKLLSLSLPATEISELVMRLITSIDREFSRACNQLERLQRLRKGEPVPAPASISVN